MEKVYLTLGCISWSLSLIFGLFMTTLTLTQDVPTGLGSQGNKSLTTVAAHPTSGSLAGGFAIAGGLCFVAAALSARQRPEVPVDELQKKVSEEVEQNAGTFFEQLDSPDGKRS